MVARYRRINSGGINIKPTERNSIACHVSCGDRNRRLKAKCLALFNFNAKRWHADTRTSRGKHVRFTYFIQMQKNVNSRNIFIMKTTSIRARGRFSYASRCQSFVCRKETVPEQMENRNSVNLVRQVRSCALDFPFSPFGPKSGTKNPWVVQSTGNRNHPVARAKEDIN